ncbi:hypothetical protein GE118_00390 [Mycoplasma sp. NEAQ87857]|uniref:hypothetical protein n=1 Tax=Mycoplasma sp. NEAQ87857 TaxID=2683967 RepID=UPI001316DA7D|nr:hypothetical protein [Mycoplasma sp. NEAQ87857]QGZ97262.1 hypothetical protein GE118_00390 [Mycoplasma sp. NEAQ87857]
MIDNNINLEYFKKTSYLYDFLKENNITNKAALNCLKNVSLGNEFQFFLFHWKEKRKINDPEVLKNMNEYLTLIINNLVDLTPMQVHSLLDFSNAINQYQLKENWYWTDERFNVFANVEGQDKQIALKIKAMIDQVPFVKRTKYICRDVKYDEVNNQLLIDKDSRKTFFNNFFLNLDLAKVKQQIKDYIKQNNKGNK